MSENLALLLKKAEESKRPGESSVKMKFHPFYRLATLLN